MDAYFLVKAHTDIVPGQNYTVDSLHQSVKAVLNENIGHYIDSVELVSESDVLHTDSIPLAEFEYLKDHPPLGVLELLRKVRALGHGETVDAALLIAINMISALNAVKVVGEAADPHADANWQALRFAVDIIDNTLPEWEMLEITPEDAKRHRERLVAMQDTELANKPFERYDSTLGDHEG